MAYRALSLRYHPDLNKGSEDSESMTRQINAAYEVLGDPERRKVYDRELEEEVGFAEAKPARQGKISRNIDQELRVSIEDLIRGVSVQVHVNDPANPDGPEVYELEIPENTSPRTRIRVSREGAMKGGHVAVRVMPYPNGRFKVKSSDLVTELRIQSHRAANGGEESLQGPTGRMLRVSIPAGVGRGELLRVAGEGLPKPRGGRGDLLVKINYRPEVRITRR